MLRLPGRNFRLFGSLHPLFAIPPGPDKAGSARVEPQWGNRSLNQGFVLLERVVLHHGRFLAGLRIGLQDKQDKGFVMTLSVNDARVLFFHVLIPFF